MNMAKNKKERGWRTVCSAVRPIELREIDRSLAATSCNSRAHFSRLRHCLYRPRQYFCRGGCNEGTLRLVADPEGLRSVRVLRRLLIVHVRRWTHRDSLGRQAFARLLRGGVVDLYPVDA